jgi:hypothetical protein
MYGIIVLQVSSNHDPMISGSLYKISHGRLLLTQLENGSFESKMVPINLHWGKDPTVTEMQNSNKSVVPYLDYV